MKEAKARLRLWVECPECGNENGLRGLPFYVAKWLYWSGEKTCTHCGEVFKVKPVWKE